MATAARPQRSAQPRAAPPCYPNPSPHSHPHPHPYPNQVRNPELRRLLLAEQAEQAEREQARKEQAAKEQAAKEQAAKERPFLSLSVSYTHLTLPTTAIV